MKVLVINPILYTCRTRPIYQVPSIVDTLSYGLCSGFVQLGHEVTLASVSDYRPTNDEAYPFEVRWFDNTFSFMPLPLPFPWSLYGYLRRESDRFDLIVCHEVFSFATLFATLTAPEKTIIRQELSLHQRKWHRLPSKFWHRCVVPLAFGRVRSIVPCSSRARQFIEQYSSRVAPTDVPLGTEIGRHVVAGPKRRQFISIGQLIEDKHLDIIINRFAEFHSMPHHDDYQLLIAGQGPLKQELESLCDCLGISQHVHFLGKVSHSTLAQHLSQSVASLAAGSKELNMMIITESVACGTPVITNHEPNDSVVIEQHGLGIVRDDWDASDMAQVATDPAYAERCRAYAPQLSCASVARQLIDVFS